MLTLLIIICAVILFFAVFEDYIEEKYKWFSFILIAICLMMYAGLRPVGFDRDSHNYETAFLSFGIITDSNSQGYETIKMKKCHVFS